MRIPFKTRILRLFGVLPTKTDRRIASLLKLMTLDEKIGQLNQISGNLATGPVSDRETNLFKIASEGKAGSFLNIKSVEHTKALQEAAMLSRMKIPLLFALDVIHGYKTTFPIPLAEAASWDMEAVELSARIAAVEASASGIHWTFAPMVDITRDPRWGRVMEGAGEDPCLGGKVARARVKGFQGKGLGATDALIACAKHFAAYGAAVGGREYDSADMSLRMLWETYLPPFKAALDAGVATFMNGFNDLNGIPATGSRYLQRDILKGRWGFEGFVVSDWASIKEMVNHGYASNSSDAAQKAFTAGNDMDMAGECYLENLSELVKKKKISMRMIDEAVERILRKKFEMGLFDDPFRFCDSQREQEALCNPEHREAARQMAEKCIVLLKNEKDILPLNRSLKIALIGPLVKSKKDMLGAWSIDWPEHSDTVTLYEALEKRVTDSSMLMYAQGCGISDDTSEGFIEAIDVANQADVVVVSIGEKSDMSGEARSRSDIHLPGVQEDLVMALCATGKPVIVLIHAGRPLIFNRISDRAPAILYTWWLGSEAGNAIANVLFGDYNPSGKLPITFPRSEGQIPVYYNHFNTGRPIPEGHTGETEYTTGYIDISNSPKFPFGYGLSYTSFAYENLKLSTTSMKENQKIQVSFDLKNTGSRTGEEIVQLYIRDRVASVVRPVKELKDFKKIKLKPGECKCLEFTIDEEMLSFYNDKLQWVAEPGSFDIMIGTSSADIRLADILEFK